MAYSDWDEYLIHQLPSTLDHVHDNDPHWTDRFYFNCHARDGSALLTCGYGVFPNQQWGAGYAKLALADGRHWDVSVERPALLDRAQPGAGPLQFTVIEPRKHWRLQLESNSSGLEFDIDYHARAPLWEFKSIFGRKQAKVIVNQQHIQQSGNYRGWMKCDGEKFSVDNFYGGRDRTWGIRNHQKIDMWIWFAAQFDDRAIAAWIWERQDGTVMFIDGGFCREDGTLSKRFVKMEHQVRFDRDLKRPLAADIVFFDEDGQRYEVQARAQHPNVNVYYGGLLDGAKGAVCGQRWNETDEHVLRKVESISVASDQLMRYEFDGKVGYGIFECWVASDGYDRWAKNWPAPKYLVPVHSD